MIKFSIKIFLFTLFFIFLSPTAFAGICDLSGSGIGGTGAPILQNQGSGIGGTGAPVSKNTGSGLGGTGAIANGSGIGGTGQKTDNQASIIIGTITGFGSICVNGIEIHYSSSTPVQVNGELANTEQLAIGQIVSVTVSGTGTEVIAQDIHVMNIVVGPITEIDPHLNQLKVLGQQVQLSEKTHVPSDNVDIAKLQKGDFVQISGLRQASGQIVASRIDRPITFNRVHLSGTATSVSPHGFMIAGMQIDTPVASTIKEGQEVFVAGHISTNKIIAQQITIPTIADNQQFKLEGFAHIDTKDDGNIQIKIGSIAIEANEQIKERLLSLNPEQSIIIDGSKEAEHGIRIEHLFIKDAIEHPEDQDIPHTKTHIFKELDEDEKHNEYKETLEHVDNHDLEKETEESESPEVKSIEIEIPEEEESPETEEHEIEESEVETPEVEVPEIETPEIEVPEIETPEVEVPEIETPEVEVPEIETPEIEVPEIETPEVEVPEIETPEIEVPEIETPEVEVPEIETPEVEIPEIETPEVEVPEIETPEIEDNE